jgi:hypothetical protein
MTHPSGLPELAFVSDPSSHLITNTITIPFDFLNLHFPQVLVMAKNISRSYTILDPLEFFPTFPYFVICTFVKISFAILFPACILHLSLCLHFTQLSRLGRAPVYTKYNLIQ